MPPRIILAGLLSLLAPAMAHAKSTLVTAGFAGAGAGSRAPGSLAERARDVVAARLELLGGASEASLVATKVSRWPHGAALVRLTGAVAGVPVVGRSADVRFDASGRVVWVRSSLARLPDLGSSVVLSPAQAVEAAWAATRTGRGARGAPRAVERVIFAPPWAPARPAYRVRLPSAASGQPSAWVVTVDANTGDPLWAHDGVWHAGLAHAFDENPEVSPLGEVTLPLPAGATNLVGAEVDAQSCVDQRICSDGGVHACSYEHIATADVDGNFLAWGRPGDDADPSDPFAEVQAFFHINKGLAAVRKIDPAFVFESGRLTAVANMRTVDDCDGQSHRCQGTVYTGSSDFVAFNNAFFAEAGSFFPDRAVLVFGQGAKADFAYDGDVVYHELGHAVVTSNNDLNQRALDEAGLDATLGGLHEGYADYLSSVITGDPFVGEYAGKALGRDQGIRSLLNAKTCPADQWGESHRDSEPWSAALWAARLNIDETSRAGFDAAVYRAMSALDDFDGFTMAAALTVAEVRATLGDVAAKATQAAFAARGIDGCGGRVVPMTWGEGRPVALLAPPWWLGLNVAPPPLQFQVTLPAAAAALRMTVGTIRVNGTCATEAPAPAIEVWIKAGAEPMRFRYEDGQTKADDMFRAKLMPLGGTSAEALASGPFPAGSLHLAVMNAGDAVLLRDISFAYEPLGPEAPVDSARDAGMTDVVGSDGPNDRTVGPSGADGGTAVNPAASCGGLPCRSASGCACALTVAPPATAACPWLAGVVALSLRRRRRQTPRQGVPSLPVCW